MLRYLIFRLFASDKKRKQTRKQKQSWLSVSKRLLRNFNFVSCFVCFRVRILSEETDIVNLVIAVLSLSLTEREAICLIHTRRFAPSIYHVKRAKVWIRLTYILIEGLFFQKSFIPKGEFKRMKKSVVFLSLLSMLAMTGCGKDKVFELAVVTDVGQLMDGGFNQGTYEGVKKYAETNKKSYKYYQPANGQDATDQDRIAAMEQAIKGGAKVIVAPGFLQAKAMTKVALENKNVKFVFVDGWSLTDEAKKEIPNVTAISYKEQESGYLAGYAAVAEGYTKLGGTFGGGGSNPACDRYSYGYAQGIEDAAKAADKNVTLKISYKYGDSFSASTELQTQISSWYHDGTEIVFSCGGSMVNSVIAAASSYEKAKVIGVDVDQASLSPKVLTSAEKQLAVSVERVLGQYYANEWDAKLGGKTQNLGAAEDATGLPTAKGSWRFEKFTKEAYDDLYSKIKAGTLTPKSDIDDNCNTEAFWNRVDIALTHVTVTLDK